MRRPDRARALARYRRAAGSYDRRWERLSLPLRRRVVEQLALRPGDTVLDVACGTGLTFDLLERAVGPSGRVIGIDLSPDMLGRARERVATRGWDNVTLIEAPVDEAEISARADAAVFVFAHDVMRTPAAVSNVVASVKPGGIVASTGLKEGPRWLIPLNAAVRAFSHVGVTTTEGLDRPWSHLEPLLDGLRVKSAILGSVYFAWGRRPA